MNWLTPEQNEYMKEFDRTIDEFFALIPEDIRSEYRLLKYGRYTDGGGFIYLSPQKNKHWTRWESDYLYLVENRNELFYYGHTIRPGYGAHDCVIPIDFFKKPMDEAIKQLRDELTQYMKTNISRFVHSNQVSIRHHKEQIQMLKEIHL